MSKLTKAEAGHLGGLATFQKYGADHMAEIGQAGAKTFWKRYHLTPVDIANYAIVDRATGLCIALTNGRKPNGKKG